MNLLDINDIALIERTTLTRKLTLGGITKPYPVYRVRLDQVFYNDQNDRIATWITQYRNDEKNVDFSRMDRDEYNSIIERFIIESNPEAISKTKNNIALVNQREPGVVLNDGRIIDGNRRFTCLRLLHKEDPTVNYFETVILDATIENSQKQIKMLELAIQHGEEQRVGYNLIDLAIGAYHDIVETKLLTIDEYSQSTNESTSEVKRRLDTARLITEFLEFMNVPKQYHIAREKQVYSVFYEFVPLLKRCNSNEELSQLKNSVFNNVMMGSFDDNRKYIRNVKAMMDSGFFSSYMKQQKQIGDELKSKKDSANIKNKKDLQEFVKKNEDAREDLQMSMDRVLLQTKKEETKKKPSQIVNKSISMLMDVDTRIVGKLSYEEKTKLKNQLSKLTSAVKLINEEMDEDTPTVEQNSEEVNGKLLIATRHLDEPIVYCASEGNQINNLAFSLEFGMFKTIPQQPDTVKMLVYFVNDSYEELCPIKEIEVTNEIMTKVNFQLNASASSLKNCTLIIKSTQDSYKEAQQMINFKINIVFNVDFDF